VVVGQSGSSSHFRRENPHDKQAHPYGSEQAAKIAHPGMLGGGTEEQNLSEPGDPSARIKEDEVDAAFGNTEPKKP
jgi:hypothetical protein